jgi:hypothetical protein
VIDPRKARWLIGSFLVGACVWAAVIVSIYLLITT